MEENMVYCHLNEWWWGKSIEIVRKDGLATITVNLDEKSFPNVAYLQGLTVLKTERKQGLGNYMLDNAIAIARKYGKGFVRLYCDKNNTWLKEWYERRGFKIFSQDEHEYEMIKEL